MILDLKDVKVENGEYILPQEIENGIIKVSQEELNNVEVRDDGTPMVRIDVPEALSEAIVFPYPNMWLRDDMATRLGHAAEALKEKYPGLLFCVNDAYRPMAKQRELFESVTLELSKMYPNLNDVELYELVTKNVADPRGGLHTGGGAIDITLVDKNGVELDMGFCEETADVSDFLGDFPDERNSLRSARLSKEVFLNRLIVSEIMIGAGFYGDNEEWWHFNGRNRAWAHLMKTACPYGDIESFQKITNVGEYRGPKIKNKLPDNLKLRLAH